MRFGIYVLGKRGWVREGQCCPWPYLKRGEQRYQAQEPRGVRMVERADGENHGREKGGRLDSGIPLRYNLGSWANHDSPRGNATPTPPTTQHSQAKLKNHTTRIPTSKPRSHTPRPKPTTRAQNLKQTHFRTPNPQNYQVISKPRNTTNRISSRYSHGSPAL